MTESIWVTLGIDSQASETDIRRAYARRLKTTRPDDDPVAFQALRNAYERAMQQAAIRAAAEKRNEGIVPNAVVDASLLSPSPSGSPGSQRGRQDQQRSAPEDMWTRRNSGVPQAPGAVARAAWHRFITLYQGPEEGRIAFAVFLRDDQLTNLAVREVFEQLCAAYCASADADPALRLAIADAFDWEKEHAHLLRAQPQIGRSALARVEADALHKDLSDFDPGIVELFSQPPSTVRHAQAKLMTSRFVIKLSKAFELVRAHPQPIVAYRFNMAGMSFWATQLQGRFQYPYWLTGILLGLWLLLVIDTLATIFRPLSYVTKQALPILVIAIMIGSVFVPRFAWIYWPQRWRQWYEAVRTRDVFVYGWLVLWLFSTAVALEGNLLGNHAMQFIGITALLVSSVWVFAAIPRTIEPTPLIFAPTLAALFGAQVLFAEAHQVRELFWPLLQGPPVFAFLVAQPMMSQRLQARLGTWWHFALVGLAWIALATAVIFSMTTAGVAPTVRMLIPFATPLLAAAALTCPRIRRPRSSNGIYGLIFAIVLINIPRFEIFVFPAWILLAIVNSLRLGWRSLREAADARAQQVPPSVTSIRYRIERYPKLNVPSALYTHGGSVLLSIAVVALSVRFEPSRVPLLGPLTEPLHASSSGPSLPAERPFQMRLSPEAAAAISWPALQTLPGSDAAAKTQKDAAAELTEPIVSIRPLNRLAILTAGEQSCYQQQIAQHSQTPSANRRDLESENWAIQARCVMASRMQNLDTHIPGSERRTIVDVFLMPDGKIDHYLLPEPSNSVQWERALMNMLANIGQLPVPAEPLVPRRIRLRFALSPPGSPPK